MTRGGKWIVWAGRVVSIAPVYILLWSARMKLTHDPWYFREWQRIGYPPSALNGIRPVQVTSRALFDSTRQPFWEPCCSRDISAARLRHCADGRPCWFSCR
jgi:hypothetical protein